MNHPSGPFASEQIQAVHLPLVLAPLGHPLQVEEMSVLQEQLAWEGLGKGSAPGPAPLHGQKILSLCSVSSSSGRCFT